jgi:hypothetical protein
VVVLNSSCNLYAPASRFVSIDQQHIRHHKRTAAPIMRAAIFFSPDHSLLFGAVYLLTTAAQRPCLAACIFFCPFLLQLFLHFFTVGCRQFAVGSVLLQSSPVNMQVCFLHSRRYRQKF